MEFDYNRQKNTTTHHTDEYENDALVLRRGATFDLGIKFRNVGHDQIQEAVLRFSIGKLSRHINSSNLLLLSEVCKTQILCYEKRFWMKSRKYIFP